MVKSYLVTPGDTITRWHVKSQTVGTGEYLVDLIEPDHNHCQCKWNQCEVKPALRIGVPPRKYCVHYHLALNQFTPAALEVFRKLDKNIPVSEQT